MKSDPLAKTASQSVSRMLVEGPGREDIVVRALQDCQSAINAGRTIDREAMLAKYPDVREELSACLDGLDLMRHSARGGEHPNTSTSEQGAVTPLATLGDFRIVREIGRGGMGVVYEAEQLSVGRRVALKVLPYAAMLDKRQITRFQNEARAAATLDHPNIVPVYFVGSERGVYYYAMRLINGKNLAEVLAELRGISDQQIPLSHFGSRLTEASRVKLTSGPRSDVASAETIRDDVSDASTNIVNDHGARGNVYFESISRLGHQAAEALDLAHSHGIIHRDIKPANILLDEVGEAWITDFGLARIEADGGMTMTGDLVGTLRYMSPEQTLSKRTTVDHRSDVYSLGATLYELLTLRPLFDGDDRASLLRRIAIEDPKPLSKVVPTIPKDLETIILKSLQKNPADRYDTAQEFADDLYRFLSHEPVKARRTPLSRRLRMWARRHPAFAGAAMIVCIMALTSAAVIGFLIAKHERAARTQQETATVEIENALRDREEALDRANTNLGIANEQRQRADAEAKDANALRLLAESHAEDLRQQVYAQDMRRAFDAWNSGWTDEVEEILANQSPSSQQLDYRGFEWSVLRDLAWRPPPIELHGHEGPVHDLAVFAGGTRLASVGDDATIRIWNLETNRQEFTLVDTRKTVQLMGDLGDVWDERLNSEELLVSKGHKNLRALAVSPDGKRLATGNLVLSLWDLENRAMVRDLTVFPTRIFGVAFSPDGHLVAAHSSDEGVRVLNLNGELVLSELTGMGAYRLCFSPDGSRLVAPFTIRQENKKIRGIRCWHVDDWDRAVDYPLRIPPRGCAFSSDGQFLFCGGYYGEAFVMNLESGEIQLETPDQRSRPSDIAISRNDRTMAVSYQDGTVAISRLSEQWKHTKDPVIVRPQLVPVHEGAANAVQFIDENKIASCGDDGVIRISSLHESPVKRSIRDEQLYNLCRFRPDTDKLIMATRHGIRSYDTKSWELATEAECWDPHDADKGNKRTMSLTISHDGNVAGIGNSDGEIVIYNLNKNQIETRIAQTDIRVSTVGDISFSPDGKWMANGSRDHTVRIRSTVGWQEVYRIDTKGWGTNVEFSPDGRFLTYSDSDGRIAIVETETWRELARVQAESGLPNRTLRLSIDGQRLITGHKDSTIRIWNTEGLTLVGELKGHMKPINGLALHPDGKTLASVSRDRTIRLWHLPTRSQIGMLDACEKETLDCHFSGDGSKLVVTSDGLESECQVWDLSAGKHGPNKL